MVVLFPVAELGVAVPCDLVVRKECNAAGNNSDNRDIFVNRNAVTLKIRKNRPDYCSEKKGINKRKLSIRMEKPITIREIPIAVRGFL